MSKNLKRAIAALVASLGIFAFAGCGKTDSGNNGANSDGNGPITGTETEGPSTGGPSTEGPSTEGPSTEGPSTEGPSTEGPTVKPPEPVIPTVPAGNVQITKAAGDLEAAYVTWNKVDGAMGYNVYYKSDEGGSYIKLDAPLVREYKTYCRADAVGLKAGKYTLKVVPTGGAELSEDESKAATAEQITVLPHERSGYAFVNGTSSGAYNDDGTIQNNANVIYVTDANKDTVELGGVSGIQNILQAQKKATVPLCIRLIGNVTAPAVPDKSYNSYDKSLQIKENAKGLTLEGIGSDATANGWTLRLVKGVNVEVRNIGFMNTQCSEPDGVSIENGNHIWVHNCDLFYGGAGGDNDQAKGDGALDTKLASYVTHSYNHFWDSGKCNLQGMKNEVVTNYITYHHNWYDHSDSRHPRIRTCTTHIYNNYFDGNAKYGVGVTTGASAFVENNYFRSTATMKPMLVSSQGTDAKGEGTFSGEAGGVIKAYGNHFEGNYSLITQEDTKNSADVTDIDCYLASSRDETVPEIYKAKAGKKSEGAGTSYSNFDTAADFYEYEVDSPEVAKEKVEMYAGRIGGGDFKWEFNDATEDTNYSIITALKTALTNYSSDLVKAGGEAVTATGGPTTGGTTGEGGPTTGEGGGNTTIEGEVTFIPSSSGNGFTVSGSTKSHSAITIAGIEIAKNSALKLDKNGKVEFETTEEMTLYLYLLNNKPVKVDGSEKTLTAESSYYVVSFKLSAGKHEVTQSTGGENSLYLIKLVPTT